MEHLHAMVTPLTHGKEPLPINDNTGGTAELAVAAAPAADGSNMGAVAVPQHLHAVIVLVGHKDVPCTIKGNANGT